MNFIRVLQQEFKTIFSDVALVLTVVGGVILYAFLYPQPYVKENVTNIPMGIVTYDQNDLTRDIVFALDSIPSIQKVYRFNSVKEALHALRNKEIYGYLVIPNNFKRDILTKKRPQVTIVIDGSYFLIFGEIVQASLKTLLKQALNQEVSILLKQQTPLSVLPNYIMSFSNKTIELFNPNNSYTQYVLPAVFILILQQTLLIGLGIVGGGVRERVYLQYNYNANVVYVMLSRYIIFLFLFSFHLIFYLGFVFDFFKILHIGLLKDIIIFGYLFISAVIACGLFFGSLLSKRELATPIVLFSSLVFVFSTGFVWPKEMIPFWIIDFSYLFPSTLGINGFLQLNQLGATLKDVRFEAFGLIIQFILYGFLAYWRMKDATRQ